MSKRQRVAVLMGGPDAERPVSIMSGRAVAAALRECGGFDVIEQIIDQPDVSDLRALNVDVVFPVLHGHWGEGGPLQELLERAQLPYVGSGPTACAQAMNKITTKQLLLNDNIQTPRSVQLEPDDDCPLQPPLVLKPVDDGSSVDLRICHTAAQVREGRRELHPKRGTLMAEQFVKGREVTVGILDGRALPLIEIIPAVEFYDYDAKYERDDTQYVIDPRLPGETGAHCCRVAELAFSRLNCRDLARVDFIVNDEGAWFLEINTMPGFTSHSLLPMAARATGLEMPVLCERLVSKVISRSSPPSVATAHLNPSR